MRSLQPRRLPRGGCPPNLGQTNRITLFLPKRRRREEDLPREQFSTRALRKLKPLPRRSLTRGKLGGHRHLHTRQNTSRHRGIGIPTIPSCGPLQNMDTLTRCIPAPALFITGSRITFLARIRRQPQVTRHRRMGTINSRTLSEHPKHMNLRHTNLPRRRQLWSILCRSPPVDQIPHLDDDVDDCIFILYLV